MGFLDDLDITDIHYKVNVTNTLRNKPENNLFYKLIRS